MDMTSRYRIRHHTEYSYEAPVRESMNEIRLTPGECSGQQTVYHQIEIVPSARLYPFRDPFGNRGHTFYLPNEITALKIQVQSEVDVWRSTDFPSAVFAPSAFAQPALRDRYYLYLMPTHHVFPLPELGEWASRLWDGADSLEEALLRLNRKVHQSFTYQSGVTDATTRVDDLLRAPCGVCQDYTHWMLAVLRMAGLPCRYVSGYIFSEGEELLGSQAMHAWVEVLVGEDAWMGLDPTNNCVAGSAHLAFCRGRDYKDITPVKGIHRGATSHRMQVSVSVVKLN